MSNLEYSLEAKNILNKFHNVEKILYVEGIEDIPFWELIFDKLAQIDVEIQEVGGKEELKKYSDQIIYEGAEYLVAMDSDYETLLENNNHEQMLYTYGYSIENSLINAESLSRVLRNVGKFSKREVSNTYAKPWTEEVSKSIISMVYADIICQQDGLNLVVIPDNSDRFMMSRNSCTLCADKISSYLDEKIPSIPEDRIEKIQALVDSSELNILDIVKGHFLFSMTLRFLKFALSEKGKKVSISKDMLFGNLLSTFENVFGTDHPHFDFYQKQILRVV